jgi:tRNA (guanine-N7-)-methyltransferase
MTRTKQKRLLKLNDLKNVFSINSQDIKESLKNYFQSENNFTLEIGCGHGDYSVELAQQFPDRNFLGIDVKGARIFNGAIKVLDLKLKNVAFVLTKAERLNEFLKPKSVKEIYIPFPEPHQKRSNQNRRLVSPPFLKIYKELLSDSGVLHFKTDNEDLYEYAIKSILNSDGKIIHKDEDLHSNDDLRFSSGTITIFEKHYINEGKKIKYICFKF